MQCIPNRSFCILGEKSMAVPTATPPYKKASEKVLEILEEEIFSGTYKPGDRLVEREVADRIGVSRVPVREALITLERWGFVKPKGANEKWREIAVLSKRDIHDFYHSRCFIECQAFSEKSLEGDHLLYESLLGMVREMDDAARIEDVDTYRKLNVRFHHEFVLSLNNRKLYQIYTDISRMLQWFQNITLYLPRMTQSNAEHHRLLDAYQKKDLYEIRRLFQRHYAHAVEVLTERF